MERLGFPMLYDEEYGLRPWLEQVDWRGDCRCESCYRLRLRQSARVARERGLDAVSTTLLVSRHQDHDLVRRVGEECAESEGVEFLYRDWRPLAEEAHEEAARMRLYLQQYCGCVFSEYERYRDTTRHLYRGAAR
jgi:predicted adenine nucleotide alpha hydrolase (AANH) superfamily ATPase